MVLHCQPSPVNCASNAWLDHAPLPWQVKSIWAHHRYLVGRVPVQ